MFDPILEAWQLTPDGTPFETHHSWLMFVRTADGAPTVLKYRKPASAEVRTAKVLLFYDGLAAVHVLRETNDITLMERAVGSLDLMHMATHGEDERAAHIIADVVAQLHVPRAGMRPDLQPLSERFAPLLERQEPRFALAVATAQRLLDEARPQVVLHGDLHHDNILHDEARGWLAIDPNGLLGERTYDVANLLCNPWPHGRIVHDPERMTRIATLYAERLALDPERILDFALAHAGLAAAWALHDQADPGHWLGCVDVLSPLVSRNI